LKSLDAAKPATVSCFGAAGAIIIVDEMETQEQEEEKTGHESVTNEKLDFILIFYMTRHP